MLKKIVLRELYIFVRVNKFLNGTDRSRKKKMRWEWKSNNGEGGQGRLGFWRGEKDAWMVESGARR